MYRKPRREWGYDYAWYQQPHPGYARKHHRPTGKRKPGHRFGSGLAAIDAVVKLLNAGDEILAVDDIYGGAFRLFTHIYENSV